MTTKEEVKALWKRCFDDSDAFTDLYFDRRYKEEINRVVRRNGKIISALQAIPYPMTFCGEVIPVSYISGACTHPDYRKHGAMKRLLTETHRRMYADGVWLAALIPAEEWLFGYYARSGYVAAFGYAQERIQADALHPAADCRVEVCELPGAEHHRYLDSRLRRRRSCILHTEEDFGVIQADLKLGGGKLLVARGADGIVGMAWAVGGEMKELLADTEGVRDALLSEAAHIYKVQYVEICVPATAEPRWLGMARVIRAEEMLGIFARAYPAAEHYIHLEGDEAIAENNGYYTLRRGVCLRGRIAGKEYRSYTPDTLTRLLLEAEHPYMSLMLN